MSIAPRPEPAHLVVFGVSGCGKSTVAAEVAHRTGRTFLEGDQFHPAANIGKMRSGTPLTDDDRAPWLVALTRALSAEPGGAVLACSALKRAYRAVLAQAAGGCQFVELRVDPTTLLTRMRSRDHFMPTSLLTSQLHTLEHLGADENGFVVDAGRNLSVVVQDVLRTLPTGRLLPPGERGR